MTHEGCHANETILGKHAWRLKIVWLAMGDKVQKLFESFNQNCRWKLSPPFSKENKLFLTIALTPALNNWVSQITEFSNKFEQWLIVLTHAVLLFRAVSFIAILSIFTRYGIGASSRSNTLISRANTGCTATPRWPARPTTIHFCENKKRNIAKRQISSSYLSNSNEFY